MRNVDFINIALISVGIYTAWLFENVQKSGSKRFKIRYEYTLHRQKYENISGSNVAEAKALISTTANPEEGQS